MKDFNKIIEKHTPKPPILIYFFGARGKPLNKVKWFMEGS